MKSKLVLGLVALFLAVGCNKKPIITPVPVTSSKAPQAPQWIDNPLSVPGIVGVGVEAPNVLGDTMTQRKIALAMARGQVAVQVRARVQEMFAALTQQSKSGSDATGKVLTQESMGRMVEDTMRELVDVELVGATTRQFWTDPDNGKLWVLVSLDKEAVHNAAEKVLRKELKDGSVDLQAALVRMDEALDRQTKR
jgi:hypothetical protein